LHYYAQREELIRSGYNNLVGENPTEGGCYINVWAPRQTGKSWLMQEVVQKVKQTNAYEIGIISLEPLKTEKNEKEIITLFIHKIAEVFQKKQLPEITKIRDISFLFTKKYFQKPVILIIDEFDSLEEDFINGFASIFRDIFISRTNERDKKSKDKTYLLHGLGLVGVRSVLGIENVTGSPFNVQRSLHIPNLTNEEVNNMFKWYEKESGQSIKQEVTDKVYEETRGQPGLTCWFGELLTETYNEKIDQPITMNNFERIYTAATDLLPNNNILNIISKAKQEPYKSVVLELFRTDDLIDFKFDNEHLNFLYMNGVIEPEEVSSTRIVSRFASPFVQKRLFNYFSNDLFGVMGRLVEPFDTLEDAITEETLNIRNIMKRYQNYLVKNKEWLLKDAPRRKDLRIFEAVYHFNVYMYLHQLLRSKGWNVHPEFPTGNGKIDIVIENKTNTYGIELKSYGDYSSFKKALTRAADYGKKLGLKEISLVFFIEYIDDKNRGKYEKDYLDERTGVRVIPIFVDTGG
jgi:hypothetical protein